VESVRWRTEGSVGYIRITQFNEQTTLGLEEAVAAIEAELGTELVGYVLDLRNNPGGLLSEAISVSDAFLERGEIVSTRGRHEEDMQRYNARPGDLAKGLPVVVLINDGSASASEIVAGALKDHQRAILMGTRSFGKGSVQTIVPLPGHGAMRLTTSRYYTPSGVSIQATGITPDIEVALATIEVIEQSERHEEDLRGILTNPGNGEEEEGVAPEEPAEPEAGVEPTEPEEGTDPDAAEGTPPDAAKEDEKPATAEGQIGPENDYQLQRALDLLRGYALFSQRMQTE
jgi:carboxyl-terminal processing protease